MYIEVKSCLDYSVGKKSFNTESVLSIDKNEYKIDLSVTYILIIEFNSFNDIRFNPAQNESVLFFDKEADRDRVYDEIIKAMGGLKIL